MLPGLSLNDTGSRNAQRITLSIRLSPTNAESKLNEVRSLRSLLCIAVAVKLYKGLKTSDRKISKLIFSFVFISRTTYILYIILEINKKNCFFFLIFL